MITATELLDFLTKAQRVCNFEVTFIQVDGGYYITLYGDWHDDNNYSRQNIYISNEGESTWEMGDYDFETMSTILDEMVRELQREIKERKRQELIARLTDEEKELLNLK